MDEILDRILDHVEAKVLASYISSPFGETKEQVVGFCKKATGGDAQTYPRISVYELPGTKKRFPQETKLRFKFIVSTNSMEYSRQIAHRLFECLSEEYDFDIVSAQAGKEALHVTQFAPIDTPSDIGFNKGIFDYAFNYQFIGD